MYNGIFYCDEVLVCVLFCFLLEYWDVEIVWIWDFEKFVFCDIVVDVGGEYDFWRY